MLCTCSLGHWSGRRWSQALHTFVCHAPLLLLRFDCDCRRFCYELMKSGYLDCWEINLQLCFIRGLFCHSIILYAFVGCCEIVNASSWDGRSVSCCRIVLSGMNEQEPTCFSLGCYWSLKSWLTHLGCFHIFHVLGSQALSFILLCKDAQWFEFMLDTAYMNAVLSLAKACDLFAFWVGCAWCWYVCFLTVGAVCEHTLFLWERKKTLISLATSTR